MNVVNGLKSGIVFVSQTLNQPIVKETVKIVAGVGHLAFAALAVCSFYNHYDRLKISSNDSWEVTAHKVMTLACVAGVICTGLTSQPGVFIASRLLGLAFSTPQLERVFGPNTIFVINPTHPRHIISIAGAILMAPQALHNFYLFGKNVCQKISAYRNNQIDEPVEFGLLLLPFIELTTRPVLHLGNRLVSLMIA